MSTSQEHINEQLKVLLAEDLKVAVRDTFQPLQTRLRKAVKMRVIWLQSTKASPAVSA